MNNDSSSDHGSGKFILSYELLYLLQWIIDNESETLQKIVARAVSQGVKASSKKEGFNVQIDNAVQQSIIDFLELLDTFLTETQTHHSIKRIVQRNTIPAVDHIDSSICDNNLVNTSLEKAQLKNKGTSSEDMQNALFEELLKRWKPHKKHIVN